MQQSGRKKLQFMQQQRILQHQRIRAEQRALLVKSMQFDKQCQELDENVEMEYLEYLQREKQRTEQARQKEEQHNEYTEQLYHAYLQENCESTVEERVEQISKYESPCNTQMEIEPT